METFADWLRNLLRQRGISQTDLARRIGVRPSSVSEWLSGKRTPKAPACEALAEYAHVPVEEVLKIAKHLKSDGEIETELPRFVHDQAMGLLAALPYEIPVFEDLHLHAGSGGMPIQIAYLPASTRKRGAIVGLLIAGDCMEPTAYAGDIAVIDLEQAPADGHVVAVETEDGWALRRYIGGHFECDNPDASDHTPVLPDSPTYWVIEVRKRDLRAPRR